MSNAMSILEATETRQARQTLYPTPLNIAHKMLEGIDWRMLQSVLEPSAGMGDLWVTLQQ